jgi:hypothetical protein
MNLLQNCFFFFFILFFVFVSRTSESKLNNLTRVEPSLHTLEVPYDTNTAYDIMTEKPGVAPRLMYQVYVSIMRKEKSHLTGAALETMRPPAPVKLEAYESVMYREVRHLTKLLYCILPNDLFI